jgi:hypothetical protein
MVADTPARTEPINFCSVFAKNAGEEPIGSAWSVKRFFMIEVALPWPYLILEARNIPPGMPDAVNELYSSHPDWGIMAIAPDPAYSIPGKTRIIDLDFSASPLAKATRRELLVDFDQAANAVNACSRGEELPENTQIDDFPYRDMLICTHGAIDACCAKFGFPAYSKLRHLAQDTPNTRIWRCSHFGGHRFAPTMLDLPDGRYWGFLDDSDLESILFQRGSTESVRGCYRGWAGYDHPAEQLLEREAFTHEGWAWLDWPQSCEILERGPAGEPVKLAITAYPPTGKTIRYEGRIEDMGELTTLGETNGEPFAKRIHRIADLRRTML